MIYHDLSESTMSSLSLVFSTDDELLTLPSPEQIRVAYDRIEHSKEVMWE